MQHIFHRARHVNVIRNVRARDAEFRLLHQMLNIRIHASNEIVKSEDVPSFREQPFAKMRPQKSCTTSHDRTHAPSSKKSTAQCNVSFREHPIAGASTPGRSPNY